MLGSPPFILCRSALLRVAGLLLLPISTLLATIALLRLASVALLLLGLTIALRLTVVLSTCHTRRCVLQRCWLRRNEAGRKCSDEQQHLCRIAVASERIKRRFWTFPERVTPRQRAGDIGGFNRTSRTLVVVECWHGPRATLARARVAIPVRDSWPPPLC